MSSRGPALAERRSLDGRSAAGDTGPSRRVVPSLRRTACTNFLITPGGLRRRLVR